MREPLKKYQLVERSIQKTYHKVLWTPFVRTIKKYQLIREGDRIAVCISGGKDSMLLAKLMQLLQRHSDFPFELVYLVMDPGYNEKNRKKIESNAALLNIPITVFETDIFDVANSAGQSPCYLCARMRRGHLYAKAKELGCNKIALGHHLNDVIETTVMAMFYGSQLQAMLPKLHSTNFKGMELIRPLYCIREKDILAWKAYNALEFLQCACRFTENSSNAEDGIGESKRQEIKQLIQALKKDNPEIEASIFNSIHSVNIETFPGYKKYGVKHSYLEEYDVCGNPCEKEQNEKTAAREGSGISDFERQEQLQRIGYYEELLKDAGQMLQAEELPVNLRKALEEKIRELGEYYGSDVWKQDLAADEAGLLPEDLPRGVLSEDGIYNVLELFNEHKQESSIENP